MPRRDEQIAIVGSKAKQRRKRKRMIFEANACTDRQWPDYKEAVYPVLRDLGFFNKEQP